MHFDLKGTLYFGCIYKVTILAEDPHRDRHLYGNTKDILFNCKRADVQQVKQQVIRNTHPGGKQKTKMFKWNQ